MRYVSARQMIFDAYQAQHGIAGGALKHWIKNYAWQFAMVAFPFAAWVIAAWSMINSGGV